MTVKKKGSKWHPVGKSGKLWKTGYPTEAKAKKALTQANKYFKSMKSKGKSKKRSSPSKSSKKKKTKKRKASPKKKPTGGRKMTANRMSPINKSGLKIVTLGLLGTLAAAVFTAPRSSDASPWQYGVKQHDWTRAVQRLKMNFTTPGSPTRSVLTGTGLVWGGAAVAGKKSISFVQFS